jgi:FkbH-like protein
MPLHLETLLNAHLIQCGNGEAVQIASGHYGDLWGNLERARDSSSHSVAVVIEWPDLDPRLGLRSLGGWSPDKLPDIIKSAQSAAKRLAFVLSEVSRRKPVALSLPTLPLPPVGYMASNQAGNFEFRLRESINEIALSLVGERNCRIVNSQELDICSPMSGRADVKSELHAGFPYTIPHASIVAELLARLIRPVQPKKGLITDLDDTFWDGIVGEVGIDGVSWCLESNTQIHGLYQQLLAALADSGVLIAVASKNDPSLVEQAFDRDDLLLSKDKVFPFEVNWGRKSESVKRILSQWNIGSDAVVYIDDSPMEIAEVSAGHEQIECRLFPKGDDEACYMLLQRLRDLFGRGSISEEDTLRRESLRQGRVLMEVNDATGSLDAFLENIDSELEFDWNKSSPDPRALELINKTNQFNLNGLRVDEGGWLELMQEPDRFLLVVSYRDKFGPLGRIATLSGTLSQSVLEIDTWVMSCRAFSRRIEYACIRHLLERYAVDSVSFAYEKTDRNGPLQEFLQEVLGAAPGSEFKLTRKGFDARCPRLVYSKKEIVVNE